jgi:N-acetylneuraminic acid mutarotase
MIRPLPFRLIPACVILAACSDSPTSPDQADLQRGPAAVPAVIDRWVTRANLPSDERFGLTTAAVTNAAGQSVLYAIGGQTQAGGFLTRVQAYNVATNTWSNRAPLPRALHWTNGAGVINGKIYVSGGESGNNNFRDELLVYDPATNTWTEKSPMPTQGFRGVTGVIDGKLYVVTNCGQESCADFFTQALYRYNPATDRWTVLAQPRFYHGWGFGGVIGGKFYVTGGSSALEAYDPTTNAWSTKASLPRRRWLGAGTALGGRLYVIGGFEEKADGSIEALRRTSVYNPASDTWVLRAPFPEAFISRSASRVSLNGKPRIHVVGGLRPGNNRAYIP